MLNYNSLFQTFCEHRKIKLIRYLFNEASNKFSFTVDKFVIALECEAYDICVLLYDEFKYLMRENSSN